MICDYFIRIDRSTICKNPDAGKTSVVRSDRPDYHLYMQRKGREYTVYYGSNVAAVTRDLQLVQAGGQLSFESRDGEYGTWTRNGGLLCADVPTTKPDGCTLHLTQNREELHWLTPLPDYLYEYVKTLVRCCSCDAEFPHTELREEWDDDSNYGSQSACPRCGEWDCCKLQYERFTPDMVESVST